MARRSKIHWLAVTVVLLAPALPASAQDATHRPPNWARKIEVAGVKNCYQVTPNLYRGAQPTAAGMAHLQALGVRYVVSLRFLRSDRHELRGSGLKSLDLGMVPWHANTQQVVEFLKAVTNTNDLPAFVHCEYGADRTGLMCAMYRIAVCGWTKQEAIAEMKNGGFHFRWKPLVSFIEKADIADIKRRAGLAGSQVAD